MTSKAERAANGPGWGEVIFGAVLSLILGLALGVVLMILKPVATVKEMPKEPVADTLYYVEGLRGDSNAARQALLKRKAFVEGKSISVTEAEINALASAAAPQAPQGPAKPGDKGAPAAAPKSNDTVSAGTPNVRIRNGTMQVGVPVTLNVFGVEQHVIAIARGGFEKRGDVFAYDPSEMYVGSCPVQRLPFVASFLRSKILQSQKIPEDISAAWAKLTDVSIEGNALKLTMP